MHQPTLKFVCLLFWLILMISPVRASTIWGVSGGGSLIAKNIDFDPSYYIRLSVYQPENDYKYLAVVLFGRGIKPIIQGGINEKGLVVVSAAAPVKKADMQIEMKGLNERIFRNNATVDGFLAHQKEILASGSPGFFLIADKDQLALIELAPDGKDNVQVSANGPLFHTNHYLTSSLVAFNEIPGQSSQIRYQRIKDLMKNRYDSFNLDDFINISRDQHDGPNNSLWRIGETATSERTLATWIVYLPSNGPPIVYIKTANIGEKTNSARLILDQNFWDNQPAGEIAF